MTVKQSPSNLSTLNAISNEYSSVNVSQSGRGLCLNIDNLHASASLSLFGGHLLSFIPKRDQRERLWLSEDAIFDGVSAIRGGVPICWPWFGPKKSDKPSPSHGVVRDQMWTLYRLEERKNSGGEVCESICYLKPSQLGRYSTPEDLSLTLKLSIAEHCEIALVTENNSHQPVELSQAIHSYFAIDDIESVLIVGLNGTYFDKLSNTFDLKSPPNYRINAETDRVHTRASSSDKSEGISLVFSDKNTKQNTLSIEHNGHNATVVWNPWVEKSSKMKDMREGAYRKMICIEAATEPSINLAAGQTHVLTQRFN
jgi:glucose-6-phosphate 1-epimerase